MCSVYYKVKHIFKSNIWSNNDLGQVSADQTTRSNSVDDNWWDTNGTLSQCKDRLCGIGIPIIKMWLPSDRLIFIMGIFGKTVSLYWVASFARTHGCVRNDSETHETVLLDSLLSHTYSVQTELRWLLGNEFNTKKLFVVTCFSNSQFVPLRCWVLVKHAI